MILFLAWQNAFHHRGRAIAVIAGIAFSLILIFMQLGIYYAGRHAQSAIYETLNFDLMLVSDKFQSINEADYFPSARLFQAGSVSGVDQVGRLNISVKDFINPVSGMEATGLIIGLEPDSPFIHDKAIRQGLQTLNGYNPVLIDRLSSFGLINLEDTPSLLINEKAVSIQGAFSMGTDFKYSTRVITDTGTYYKITGDDPGTISLGMIRVKSGYDPMNVKKELQSALSPTLIVLERQQMIQDEQDYFLEIKPVGVIFKMGVLIAFVAGVVLLFQTLASDIMSRWHEFATARAIGLTHGFVYLTGLHQALIYTLIGYIVSLLIATVLFILIRSFSHLNISMDAPLAGMGLLVTLMIGAVSSLLAVNRLRAIAPTDLFE